MKINVRYTPPADEAFFEDFRTRLLSAFGVDSEVIFTEDRSLLGGFRVYADGKFFDMSLRTRLDEISAELLPVSENAK